MHRVVGSFSGQPHTGCHWQGSGSAGGGGSWPGIMILLQPEQAVPRPGGVLWLWLNLKKSFHEVTANRFEGHWRAGGCGQRLRGTESESLELAKLNPARPVTFRADSHSPGPEQLTVALSGRLLHWAPRAGPGGTARPAGRPGPASQRA